MFISMNYENSCVYLCFCCVDTVDCGVGWVRCVVMSWVGGLGWVGCPALWILDQVQYDVTSWPTGTQRGVARAVFLNQD